MSKQHSQTRRRREKLRDLVREEILAAAATVFVQRGFAKTTMQHVAKAAGFGAASLYTYFPSKEVLYAALLENAMLAVLGPLSEPVDARASLEKRLTTLLSRQLTVMSHNLEIFLLFSQPTTSRASGEAVQSARDAGYPKLLLAMERWMKDHSSAAERGGASPRLLTITLVGLGQALVMEHLFQGHTTGFEALAQRIAQQALFGLRGKATK